MAAIVAQVQAATAGLAVGGVAMVVKIGTDWPPQNVLQDIARTGYVAVNGQNVPRGGTAIISVFDRKAGKNSTRWSPDVLATTTVMAQITSAIASPADLPPYTSTTITLGGPGVGLGDAVSIIATNSLDVPAQTAAVVKVAGPTETTTTMATALAALVNADLVLSTWLLASASGAVVTLTNKTSAVLVLQSYTGNGGSQTREVGRMDRQVQVSCWVPTIEARSALVGVMQTLFANLQIGFLTTAGGESAQLTYQSDYDMDDDTATDIYRHDFLLMIDYPLTTVDLLYAIVAPVQAFSQ